MTTQLALDTMSLPPPVHLDLHDGNRLVGWVSRDTIGFRGFGNEDEAVGAAWMAHRTLSRRLAWRDGHRPVPIDLEPLAIEWRDGRETILAGARPIGTLVRPAADSRSGPDSFGFEIPMPPADEQTMRSKARLLYRTLRRSGIRWQLWRRDVAGSGASPAELADGDRGPFSVEGRTMAHRDGPGRYGFAGPTTYFARPAVSLTGSARSGRPASPSATAFLARVILTTLTIVTALVLLFTAPRAVTVPIAAVVGAGLIASGLVRFLARRGRRGGPPRGGPSRPASTRPGAGRRARAPLPGAGWSAVGWLSTAALAVAMLASRQADLAPGSFGAALGAAGLAALVMIGHARLAVEQPRLAGATTRGTRQQPVDAVDAASTDSFPASDPPSWTAFRPGAPAERRMPS